MTTINTPPKKQIPFIEILKQAGQIVWKNRFLLWFGLLLALGSPGSFNLGNNEDNFKGQEDKIQNFISSHWQIVIMIGIVFFAIGIALLLISLVAKAGLVKSVNLIAQNKPTSFRSGWQSGKKYLGKLFGIGLLFFLAILILVIVLAIPVVYLVANQSWIGAILVGILAFAILIPLLFVFSLTKIYSEFYIILSDLGIQSAIEAGYDLLAGNLLNSLIFSLLLAAVSMAAFIILIPVAGISLLILVPVGFLFYYLNKIVFAVFLVFAVLIFLSVILFFSSIFQAYRGAAWTLFFKEIAKVEKLEKAMVAEEAEKSIASAPAAPPASTKLQKEENLDDPEKA